jgi:hypothetical protein
MDCCSDKGLIDMPTDAATVSVSDARQECPACGRESHTVTRKTVLLMLKPRCFDRMGDSEYRFCADPECRLVYFAEDGGESFTTEDVRVRVGLKEREDPIPLCYCFGFDEADVRQEIRATGQCSIPQRIGALIRRGMCACVERNPSGKCCLGVVSRAVKNLMSETVESV